MPDPYAPPAAAPSPTTGEAPAPPRPASMAAAAILTFLFVLPAGHFYVGRPIRGLVWFSAVVAYTVIVEAFAPSLCRAIGIAGMAVWLGGVLAITVAATVDAARLARRRTQRVPVWLVVLVAVGAVIVGRVFAVAERALLLEAFKVPSGSMQPTIAVGDHLLVDKKASGAPRRGDVIVFPFPEQPNQDFIKRVIGVGGDDIEIKDGALSIDGWQVPRCRVGEWQYQDASEYGSTSHAGALWVEFLGDASYLVFDDRAGGAPFEATMGPWHVKPGEVFVMGDNRNNAHDSRMWFGGQGGGVRVATVRGRGFIVWLGQNGGAVDGSRVGVDISGRKPSPPAGAPQLAADIERCMKERPAGTVGPPSRT
jgi:signal peptidase I